MKGNAHTAVKKTIFVLIVVILSFPQIQQLTGIIKVKPLKGYVKLTEKPDFTLSKWFNGDYQQKQEEYINDHFGLRPTFVRWHNQLDFWLFNKVNANNVIVGKEGYLYELSYINEYLGRNFIGKNKINTKVSKLKMISDSLAKKNIDIVVILAAGKASYFPEYFPDSLPPNTKTISNYDYFSQAFDSIGVKYIDFNSWFVNMKDTTKYPLFTIGGIHWSKYGEYLVADSLINYVEKIRGVKLPHFKLERIDISSFPKYRDNDIGEGLNIFWYNTSVPLAYPKLKIDNSGVDAPTKAMVVADSYYWELYNEGLSRDVFNKGQFWYYNKNIYSDEPGRKNLKVSEINVKEEIERNDVIFILQTEATLNRFAFGFVDKLGDIYLQNDTIYPEESTNKPSAKSIYEKEIAAFIQNIKNSDVWYSSVVEKAKNRGIPVEEMLRLDAIYMIKQNSKK